LKDTITLTRERELFVFLSFHPRLRAAGGLRSLGALGGNPLLLTLSRALGRTIICSANLIPILQLLLDPAPGRYHAAEFR